MVLDYLTENELKRYPFDDNCLLKSVEGPLLPKNTFADVVLVSKRADAVGAFLSSYVSDTTANTFILTFELFNNSGTGIASITLTVPYSNVILHEFAGIANSEAALKVVFGEGMVQDIEVSKNLTFLHVNSKLEQSAFVCYMPRVTSLSFFNWDTETNEVSVVPEASFNTTITDLNIKTAANIDFFSLGSNNLAIDVTRGGGTGLFDACDDEGLVVKAINSTGPAPTGNFLLESDSCYTAINLAHGLELDNTCKPKCTSEEMAAFAHYNNRIVDGMTTIYTFVESVANDIKNEIDRYTTDVVPTLNKPYFKATAVKSPSKNSGHHYVSVAIIFFNPTTSSIGVNVTRSGGTLAAYSESSGVLNTTIACLSTAEMIFTVYVTTGTTVTVSGTFNGSSMTWSTSI